MRIIDNFMNKSKFGLVIDWKFHLNKKWVCALTPYLVNSIIKEFNPCIISSQIDYELCKNKLDYIISMEPGWAAPKIKYDNRQSHNIGVFVSDPHNKTHWFEDYVYDNEINYVFSYYLKPFLYHFPDFDRSRLIHMPWAIPDEYIVNPAEIKYHSQDKISLFGGINSEAYETRNWCLNFPFVEGHSNSGCENKVMSDDEYLKWCSNFDAIIAAGSLSDKYQLVTPKYFEIASRGALLFAQDCEDLKKLGFNDTNCIIFDKNNFENLAENYLSDPESFFNIRKMGCQLIKERHSLSIRIALIKKILIGDSNV